MAYVGTSGNDSHAGGALGDDLSGLGGDDTLNGAGGADIIDGGAGDDTLIGGSGGDTASYASATSGVTVSLAISSPQATGGAGTDDLATFEHLLGSAFADSLIGSSGDNQLEGGVGNDTLQGGLGNDTLLGGSGTDTATYAAYVTSGGVGVDVYLSIATAQVTGAGSDILTSIENLTGSTGADTLGGNASANVLRGGEGTDELSGEDGNDTLYGGGSGTLDDGDDWDGDYDGGAGTDLISFYDAINGITLNLFTGTRQEVVGGSTSIHNPLVLNIENAEGSAFGDSITGTSGANSLFGLAGNDSLKGGAGNDTLSGGSGLDYASYAGLFAVTVDLSLGTATDTTDTIAGAGNDADSLSSIEGVIGSALGDSITGSTAANDLFGGAGNDTLNGSDGNDTLEGGLNDDSLVGGIGTDVASYLTASSAVTVNLSLAGAQATGGAGTDTLVTMEGLEGSDFNDTLTGSSAANSIDGLGGNDSVNGGAGNDTLDGGAGVDTVSYATATNYVVINLNQTTAQVTVGSGIEYLSNFEILVGSGFDDSLTGLVGGNETVLSTADLSKVYGGAGNDYITTDGGYFNALLLDELYGEAGNDTLDATAGTGSAEFVSMKMVGGDGDDTYIIGNPGRQVVSETGTSGNDTVRLSGVDSGDDGTVSGNTMVYALASGVENFVTDASTTVKLDITGNSGNNSITGSALADTMDGGTGNDTLSGGAGVNELHGSDGNDSLVGGSDTDALYGESGINTLVGGLGDDNYYLQNTADVITELSSQGNDTVWLAPINSGLLNFTLAEGSQVENVGIVHADGVVNTGYLQGNSAANNVYGNSDDNILIGGGGADTLSGGGGNDEIHVDSADDVVVEVSGEGSADKIITSINYTLLNAVYVEQLVAEGGTSNLNLTGNIFANSLFGNDGNNSLNGGTGSSADTLDGGEGDDTLDGGAGGVDSLIGGLGNDTYILASTGADIVNEGVDGGTDILLLSNTSATYTIEVNVENLTLTGATATVVTGNTLSNLITGNGAGNQFSGLDGNDTLDGGAGNDTLVGGNGDDIFIVDAGTDQVSDSSGSDTLKFGSDALSLNLDAISDSQFTGIDRVDMTGMGANILTLAAAEVTALGAASNVLLVNGEAGDTVNLTGVWLTPTTEVIGPVTYNVYASDGGAQVVKVQQLVTVNAGASSPDQSIIGDAGANFLDGGTGNDTLTGLAGNDTLQGGSGADSMVGGMDNDLYYVDNAGDVVVENVGEGNDTVSSSVSYALTGEVEYLTLTGTAANGTGSATNNTITGNSLNNILDGGAGADTMIGGGGDDSYFVDDAGDVVQEAALGGTADTVTSSATYVLANQIENLILGGSGAINGTGNSLANVITGNSGSNTLDGKGGADTLTGGAGNDIYVLENAGDTVTELAGEGTDTVKCSLAYTLGSEVERLTLTGTASVNGTGNTLKNLINGNSGDNTLTGDIGNDTLSGGDGADILVGGMNTDNLTGGNGTDKFVFDATLNATANVDTILDFGAGDRIWLDRDIFTKLDPTHVLVNPTDLAAINFSSDGIAHTNKHYILYDSITGALSYDRDGSGSGFAATQFAVLTTHPVLLNTDFQVVA